MARGTKYLFIYLCYEEKSEQGQFLAQKIQQQLEPGHTIEMGQILQKLEFHLALMQLIFPACNTWKWSVDISILL